MKRHVEGILVTALVLLSGCAGLETAPGQGSMPERVELVTPSLDEADRERLEQARDALANGKPEAAAQRLATVETEHRFHPDVLMVRSRVARHQERPRRAIRALEALLQRPPENAAAANDLALLYRQQGRIEAAAGLLRQALDANPGEARLHYNLAVLSELYLLDLEQALQHYRRYQSLRDDTDKEVAMWIQDLERRVQ
ncbi:tetratricopeptide repeat protein [Halomonadaceae bacterium KBTZ08]